MPGLRGGDPRGRARRRWSAAGSRRPPGGGARPASPGRRRRPCGRSRPGCRVLRPRPAGGWRGAPSSPGRRGRGSGRACRASRPGRGRSPARRAAAGAAGAAAPRRCRAAGASRASRRRPGPWRDRVRPTISSASSIRPLAPSPSRAAEQVEVGAPAQVGVERGRFDEPGDSLQRLDARLRVAAEEPHRAGARARSGPASSAARSSCRRRWGRGSRRRRRPRR